MATEIPAAVKPLIPDPRSEPTVGLDVAGPALGVGMTTSYELARTGALTDGVPVIRVGSKYRVSTVALRRAVGLDAYPTSEPAIH